METKEFFVTFGVQYTSTPERGETHPLGVTKDNYVTIEAPTYDMARRITNAIFEGMYAFLYDKAEFNKMRGKWYSHDGAEAFRIAWITPIGDWRA